MREQLISYVNLLFAGNPEAEEVRMEIMQNTLDRYDDLISQGKNPEAAYSLAIAGVGDVGEILSGNYSRAPEAVEPLRENPAEVRQRKLLKAIAIALYIICPLPVLVIRSSVGVGVLLVLVGIATALLIFSGKDEKKQEQSLTPRQRMKRSIQSAVSTLCLVIYFVLSFLTGAWHLTWLMFPIMGAVNGLISAIMDMKGE